MTTEQNERNKLLSVLRERVAESGKKETYYMSEDEYRLGVHLDVFTIESETSQGSDVIAVKVLFEGNYFTCSILDDD